MPRLLLALFLCLAAAPGAARPSEAKSAPRMVADMPMLFRGTSPAVNVFVNGKGPYLFLIDTGAQGDARADVSLVGEMGLVAVGRDQSGDGSGRNIRTLDRVVLARLAVGGVEFRDVAALSRDYNR